MTSLNSTTSTLGSLSPELLAEWDFPTNTQAGLDPYSIAPASGKKATWVCGVCKHQWLARISSRTRHNTGCPVCTNRVVKKGVNDLATTHPELVKQWADTSIQPSEVLAGTHRKVTWRCLVCSYRWKATVYSRTRGPRPNACPGCAGRVATANRSLAVCRPDLVEFWDDPTDPHMVLPYASVVVSWRCRRGHRWKQSVETLTRRKQPLCPECGDQLWTP